MQTTTTDKIQEKITELKAQLSTLTPTVEKLWKEYCEQMRIKEDYLNRWSKANAEAVKIENQIQGLEALKGV